MCPKCKGLLVEMGYPDAGAGVKCLTCGRNYYHQEPEAWEPERHPGMRAAALGRDVYTTHDAEKRKR